MSSSRVVRYLLLVAVTVLSACAPPVSSVPEPTATATAQAEPPVQIETEQAAAPMAMASPVATVLPAPTDQPAQIEPTPTGTLRHIVEPGETLLGLALNYDLPMAAFQLENGMGAAIELRAGQALTLPAVSPWSGASPFWVVHAVAEGETLSAIAERYGLELEDLRTVNGLAADDWLSVGQPVVLPLDAPADVAALAAAPPPTPVPPPTATPLPPAPPATSAAAITSADEPAATPTAPPEPPPAPAPPEAPADIAHWPAEVFRLVNAERAAHGLPPYAYNETLAFAARLHGQDCLQRGSCNHTGSDGSNVKTRIIRAGYDAAGWAECLVYSDSPAGAVAWWMDEVPPYDEHRRTLLSTWVTEIGIAVIPIGGGYYYFIADFGRPR